MRHHADTSDVRRAAHAFARTDRYVRCVAVGFVAVVVACSALIGVGGGVGAAVGAAVSLVVLFRERVGEWESALRDIALQRGHAGVRDVMSAQPRSLRELRA